MKELQYNQSEYECPTGPEIISPNRTHQADSGGAAKHIFILLASCTALFLVNAKPLPLANPEESRCALIVRQMIRGGDWIVPHLASKPYFDKPAPFFWLAAAGQYLTGSPELGGRLIPALAGILAVLATYAFERRLLSATAGLIGGLILVTSGEYLFMARWYRMDMPFVAAMWAAIWWLWKSSGENPAPSAKTDRRRGWIGFYVFAGIATIFKGPAGLGLPGLIVVIWLLLARRPRRLVGLFHPLGIALYLLIAAPWYLAVSLQAPGYAYEFFIRQNVLRFAGGGHLHHTWPGILYVPILLVGLLPWTIYLPSAVVRYFPRRWRERRDKSGILLLWTTAIVTVTFFAFSKTKLISYILPAFLPLAVLIGGLVANWIHSHRPDKLMGLGAKSLLITVLILPLVPVGVEVWLKNIDAWIVFPIAACLIAARQMRASLGRARRMQFVGWGLAAVTTMYIFLILHTVPAAYDLMSTRSLARLVPQGRDDTYLCFWPNKKWSFLFYTNTEDAERFHRSDPTSLTRLREKMASGHKVYCLVSGTRQLRNLKHACTTPISVLGKSGSCWLVTNVHSGRGAASAPIPATSQASCLGGGDTGD